MTEEEARKASHTAGGTSELSKEPNACIDMYMSDLFAGVAQEFTQSIYTSIQTTCDAALADFRSGILSELGFESVEEAEIFLSAPTISSFRFSFGDGKDTDEQQYFSDEDGHLDSPTEDPCIEEKSIDIRADPISVDGNEEVDETLAEKSDDDKRCNDGNVPSSICSKKKESNINAKLPKKANEDGIYFCGPHTTHEMIVQEAGFIGLKITSIQKSKKVEHNNEDDGLVEEVFLNGYAARLGIQVGDVICSHSYDALLISLRSSCRPFVIRIKRYADKSEILSGLRLKHGDGSEKILAVATSSLRFPHGDNKDDKDRHCSDEDGDLAAPTASPYVEKKSINSSVLPFSGGENEDVDETLARQSGDGRNSNDVITGDECSKKKESNANAKKISTKPEPEVPFVGPYTMHEIVVHDPGSIGIFAVNIAKKSSTARHNSNNVKQIYDYIVLVKEVNPSGYAALLGIQVGDVIYSHSYDELFSSVQSSLRPFVIRVKRYADLSQFYKSRVYKISAGDILMGKSKTVTAPSKPGENGIAKKSPSTTSNNKSKTDSSGSTPAKSKQSTSRETRIITQRHSQTLAARSNKLARNDGDPPFISLKRPSLCAKTVEISRPTKSSQKVCTSSNTDAPLLSSKKRKLPAPFPSIDAERVQRRGHASIGVGNDSRSDYVVQNHELTIGDRASNTESSLSSFPFILSKAASFTSEEKNAGVIAQQCKKTHEKDCNSDSKMCERNITPDENDKNNTDREANMESLSNEQQCNAFVSTEIVDHGTESHLKKALVNETSFEASGRTKLRKVGFNKGNGEVVIERPKNSESTDASNIKTSGASSKGGMHSAENRKEHVNTVRNSNDTSDSRPNTKPTKKRRKNRKSKKCKDKWKGKTENHARKYAPGSTM